MSQCINPKCLRININHNKFCNFCGFPLLLVKRYRPIRFLGQGGFGRTFIALDELLPSKPQCVIKQFFPQVQGANSKQKAKEMFEKEAQHLERLGTKFEQIPTLLAYFEENNYQYLVQEFIDGLTLEQELEKNGKFSQEQVKQVLIDLLFILDFLHQNKVIHRDIKPSNIIRRSSDKKLFLVDFGVSKLVEVSSNTGQWEVLEAGKWRKESRTSDTKECRYVRNWLI
ncbi:MAG: serine/threonine-protein kinase [Snowella sp.]|nr:serine/threonine-protein kinase [Snowella sp.]